MKIRSLHVSNQEVKNGQVHQIKENRDIIKWMLRSKKEIVSINTVDAVAELSKAPQ